jgi:predicted GNAT family acetyltransferase
LSYEVKHRPGMFFISLNAEKFSYLKYSIEEGQMIIMSTHTPEEFRGKGHAAKLMAKAMDYAESRNLHVVPECSYAKYYLNKRKLFKE